ncbi:MAG: hypothetical protein OIN87_03675 [Candidatus Methanoperedens sp.]|nr:hypothetical protein [Candidatus Methanoperedens sp.]
MADVINNDKGQIMLLTVFLIIIEVVSFTAILNNMILTTNMPTTGLDESKHQVRDIRLLTEAEIKKAAHNAIAASETDNIEQIEAYFYKYINSYNNTIINLYGARGASVEIIINNVSFNKTTINIPVNKYHIEWKPNNFSNGSLIIPMDGNQTQIMKTYGLIYRVVDGQVSGTKIPVWTILQNAVNSSVPNFNSTIYTDKNASSDVSVDPGYRNYSGGPFLIEKSDITEIQRQMIISEAKNKNIVIHELANYFNYSKSVKMVFPPKVAVYPITDLGPMETYYADGEIPYTALGNTEILNGNLTQFDILTIPHHDMTNEPKEVINKIVYWVADGGVLHAQCWGADTMDRAIEGSSSGAAKPWYGFIGISQSNQNKVPKEAMFIKLVDNSTRANGTYTYNTFPPLPLSGLSDPGAPYSPLAQANNMDGIFGNTTGKTPAFSLRHNSIQINPSTNILGVATYSNGTPLYGDYNSDSVSEYQLMYLEATYENGLVTYIAGHDLSDRSGNAERLIFETFFAASMRLTPVTVVSAENIIVTIKYNDGKVKFEDTFRVNI